jgi:hypothetical protein
MKTGIAAIATDEERVFKASDFGPAMNLLALKAREIEAEAGRYPDRTPELRKRAQRIRRVVKAMLDAIDREG